METAYAEAEGNYRVKEERQVRRPKKANFIKRWMLSMVKDAVQTERNEQDRGELVAAKQRAESHNLSVDPMRFSIYKAHGGFVVEVRTPSNNTRTIGPETNTKLHIIQSDRDLGEELAKIITFEGLRA